MFTFTTKCCKKCNQSPCLDISTVNTIKKMQFSEDLRKNICLYLNHLTLHRNFCGTVPLITAKDIVNIQFNTTNHQINQKNYNGYELIIRFPATQTIYCTNYTKKLNSNQEVIYKEVRISLIRK